MSVNPADDFFREVPVDAVLYGWLVIAKLDRAISDFYGICPLEDAGQDRKYIRLAVDYLRST